VFVKCPFCHRNVLKWFYPSHEAKHTKRKPDGQMQDHISAPEPERYAGSLAGIPQHYLHPKCGVVTTMPEEIIRTYLVNPLTYSDRSFCCGCNDYVYMNELVWNETGEVLMNYSGRLRQDYLREEYAMSYQENSVGVLLTPPAARVIGQELQSRPTTAGKRCLLLQCDESGVKYDIGFVDNADLATHVFTEIDGVTIIIPKKCFPAIKGTVVHYVAGPGGGLNISRLFVPFREHADVGQSSVEPAIIIDDELAS
jgi:Fe-S cluster assembly iron-binding protein IscA